MHRILFTSLDAAVAGLIMIPIFWFLNKKHIRSRLRTSLYFLLAVYLSAVFAVAGLPDIRYMRFQPHFNFEPFAYMFSDATSSLLNVLLFLPLGLFLPLLWNDYRPFWKTLLTGFFVSFLIEALQIFTFRATDVNDLITNTTGTLIGWSLARLILYYLRKPLPGDDSKDFLIIGAIVLFIMFFIHPFISELLFLLI